MLSRIYKSEFVFASLIVYMLETMTFAILGGIIADNQVDIMKALGLTMTHYMVGASIIGTLSFSKYIRGLNLKSLYMILLVLGVTMITGLSLGIILDVVYFVQVIMVIGPVYSLINGLLNTRVSKIVADEFADMIVDYGHIKMSYGPVITIVFGLIPILVGIKHALIIAMLTLTLLLLFNIKKFKLVTRYV